MYVHTYAQRYLLPRGQGLLIVPQKYTVGLRIAVCVTHTVTWECCASGSGMPDCCPTGKDTCLVVV